MTKIVNGRKSFSRAEVLAALIEANGSVAHAARRLGTSPATVHRRLERDATLRRELDEALERTVGEARARARLMLRKALDALESALDDPRRAPAATRALLEVVRATEPRPAPDSLFVDEDVARTFSVALKSFAVRLATWTAYATGRPQDEILEVYRQILGEVVHGLAPGLSHTASQKRARLARVLQLGGEQHEDES